MEGVSRTFVPRQGAEKYFHTAEHISCSTDICFGLHFPSSACQGCRAVVRRSQGTEAVSAWSLWWKLKCPSVNKRLSTARVTALAPMRWRLAKTKAKKFQLSRIETADFHQVKIFNSCEGTAVTIWGIDSREVHLHHFWGKEELKKHPILPELFEFGRCRPRCR